MRKRVDHKLDVSRVLLAAIGTMLLTVPFLTRAVQAKAHQTPTSVSSARSIETQDVFEEASIRQVNPDLRGVYSGPSECGGSAQIDPQYFSASGVTVYTLIGWANGSRGLSTADCLILNKFNSISGGPAWIRSDRFDIHALLPDGSVRYTAKQLSIGDVPKLRLMIRSLLESRFKLVLHREMREMAVYALTVGKAGFKLQEFKEGSCPPHCGSISLKSGNRNVSMSGVGFERLSELLSVFLDRPLIDRTGLTGAFDIELTFAADETTPGLNLSAPSPSASDSAATISTALQEQLGLKLESIKLPTEVFVVDQIERPAPN